jgi:hypothetical protein
MTALRARGLAAERATTTTLKVTGFPAGVERAFGVSLRGYKIAAHETAQEYTLHAPTSRARIPGEIAGAVSGVIGVDHRPGLGPRMRKASEGCRKAASRHQAGNREPARIVDGGGLRSPKARPFSFACEVGNAGRERPSPHTSATLSYSVALR